MAATIDLGAKMFEIRQLKSNTHLPKAHVPGSFKNVQILDNESSHCYLYNIIYTFICSRTII